LTAEKEKKRENYVYQINEWKTVHAINMLNKKEKKKMQIVPLSS